VATPCDQAPESSEQLLRRRWLDTWRPRGRRLCIPSDCRPAYRQPADGESSNDYHSQGCTAKAQQANRQAAHADAADRDTADRQEHAEGNVADGDPSNRHTSTIGSIQGLPGCHVNEGQSEVLCSRTIIHSRILRRRARTDTYPTRVSSCDKPADYHKAEIEKWWPIIKAANIKAQ
jgi:hypothetical protein